MGCVKRECIESSECMESMGGAWGHIYIYGECVEGVWRGRVHVVSVCVGVWRGRVCVQDSLLLG